MGFFTEILVFNIVRFTCQQQAPPRLLATQGVIATQRDALKFNRLVQQFGHTLRKARTTLFVGIKIFRVQVGLVSGIECVVNIQVELVIGVIVPAAVEVAIVDHGVGQGVGVQAIFKPGLHPGLDHTYHAVFIVILGAQHVVRVLQAGIQGGGHKHRTPRQVGRFSGKRPRQ